MEGVPRKRLGRATLTLQNENEQKQATTKR